VRAQGSVTDDLPPIAVDDTIAGLLDARFDVVEGADGLLLRGERELARGARTLLGRPTSCVGRDWELGMLTAILDECIDERRARAVVVTAAAGIGKSRLAAELVDRIQQRTEHVAIWVGRGDSLRAGSTLDLLAQALRGALGIRGGEPLAERRDQVRARVAERVPTAERRRVAEFLGELIGTPFPDGGEDGAALRMARQDAQLMSEQMRKAWLDFLQAETAAQPVLLVLEDLHWGDFGTVRFVDAALRDRGDRPWMVLALARPEVYEVFPQLWAERQNVQEIRLKELGRKAAERLVRQVLGDSVGTDTIERLVRQADGNTFYLEELIRAAAEGRADALPETVLAMVETRLGRLSLEARRVLRAASVFGEVCWESGVASLLDSVMGPATAGEWLGTLVEQEMLVVRPDSRFPGQRELAFRHALLREGAYATLTEEDRRRGHHLAGEWLEEHGERDPMMLAGHFQRGGGGARAAGHYLRAAEQALLVLDQDTAVTRAALGLACAPSQELRFALLGVRCEASIQSVVRISMVMAEAEELLREAPRGSIPWALGLCAYIEGSLLAGRIGDALAALGQLREVVPVPGTAGTVGKLSLAFVIGTGVLDLLGLIQDGSSLEAQLCAVVDAADDREPVARFWRIVCIAMRAAYAHADPWAALQHSESLLPIYDAVGGEHILLNVQLLRAQNLWFIGATAAAELILKEVVAADASMGMASSLRRFILSWLLADRGALEEARALAAQLAEYGHAHHNMLEEGRGRWVLAEVLRRMGDLDGADREIEGALRMVVPLDRPGALGTLAMLRLAQGRAAEALAAAEEAASTCSRMGGCGQFRDAFARLARAEALHATGAADEARAAIADARARLLAVAGRVPDAGYRERFLAAVPENARTLALARAWLGDDATA
jgi:hypothetical protein